MIDKPTLKRMIDARRVANRMIGIDVFEEDTRKWLCDNAPEFGELYEGASKNSFVLAVLGVFDAGEVVDYLNSYDPFDGFSTEDVSKFLSDKIDEY